MGWDPEKVYGKNPFEGLDLPDEFETAPETVPPIPEIVGLKFQIVDSIHYEYSKHSDYRARVFKARANWDNFEGTVVMKLFHSDEPAEDCSLDRSLDLFERESNAYARLLHHGICSKGVVPHCHGSYRFPPTWKSDLRFTSDPHFPLASFINDIEPPVALVLEYLPGVRPLSPWNITPELAEEIMAALKRIHEAYVLHSDLYPRNILIKKDGSPCWIDFDAAQIPPDPEVTPAWLNEELADAWSLLYEELLPDRARVIRGEKPRHQDCLAPVLPHMLEDNDSALASNNPLEVPNLVFDNEGFVSSNSSQITDPPSFYQDTGIEDSVSTAGEKSIILENLDSEVLGINM
ncbi:hypothetical protein SISSUDRAFT_1052930 [Sistotremastrum suecicum HHB10207 ss-3]|uniref:Protein kinase domain-containing protein n=1 Tax=Sistotremastrum suecicum HHB10207 ss-3 TaxID=1314776 RepID=A0A165ZJU2_9AGAM|nr:hypothetical protein SISSUDRAFT_1052930 [Sistotremastrum suecicum HHB10207 ss-3]